MKLKQQFKELIEYIEFPAFAYVYETNRMMAMNTKAVRILGGYKKNIKEITTNGIRPKYPKQVLENGSIRYYNFKGIKLCKLGLDIEVNVIDLVDRHVCLVFFQYSFRNNFGANLESEVPRVFWKNKEKKYLGMNQSLSEDLMITAEQFRKKSEGILSEEFEMEIAEQEDLLLKNQISMYNDIRMIKIEDRKEFFCKINRVPLFDKSGKVVGMLGVYHKIIDRAECRKQYSRAIWDNFFQYEEQVKKGRFLMNLLQLSQREDFYDTVLDAISKEIETYTGINSISICKYNRTKKILRCKYEWGTAEIKKHMEQDYLYYLKMYPDLMKAIKKRRCISFDKNNRSYLLNQEPIAPSIIKSFILFQFELLETSDAFICFGDFSEERVWDEEMIELLMDITQIIKLILQTTIMKREMKYLQTDKREE